MYILLGIWDIEPVKPGKEVSVMVDNHPSYATLGLGLEGLLGDDDAISFFRHLSECRHCREKVCSFCEFDQRLADTRDEMAKARSWKNRLFFLGVGISTPPFLKILVSVPGYVDAGVFLLGIAIMAYGYWRSK